MNPMRKRLTVLLLCLWAALSGAHANPRADADRLLVAVAAGRAALPVLDLPPLPAGQPGRALSKTVRRADGLSLSLFAAGVADADRAAVRNAFAAHADRTLAPLLMNLPRVTAASPTAAGVIELRIPLGGGAQLLLSWASDQPFDTDSAAPRRAACDHAIAPWAAGSAPTVAAAVAGSFRRQVWTTPAPAGQRFQRLSEWELKPLRTGGHGWIPTQDRCLPLAAPSP